MPHFVASDLGLHSLPVPLLLEAGHWQFTLTHCTVIYLQLGSSQILRRRTISNCSQVSQSTISKLRVFNVMLYRFGDTPVFAVDFE